MPFIYRKVYAIKNVIKIFNRMVIDNKPHYIHSVYLHPLIILIIYKINFYLYFSYAYYICVTCAHLFYGNFMCVTV